MDPWREEPHQLLMRLLAEELGVEPGERTDGDTAVHTDALQHPQLRY